MVLGIGLDPTDALVASQVVLSFGIPFALVPLLIIASKREVMGSLTNPRRLTAFAGVLAAMIIGLNIFLLQQVFFG
jgi:manganese transport protein